jgi:hypothetical protein
MKAQFGKQQLINLASAKRNGLGVVAAEGYRDSMLNRPASERLAPDCRALGSSLRALRPDMSMCTSTIGRRTRATHAMPTTVVPGVATVTALPAVDSRLPAPAWAAFVLNHALCG